MQRLLTVLRWTAVSALVFLLGMPATAFAQEASPEKEKTKTVKVEVKDGKVFVNGEEIDASDEPFVWEFKGEAGEDGNVFFFSDDDDGPHRFMLRRDGDGDTDDFTFFSDDGDVKRFRSRMPGALPLEGGPEREAMRKMMIERFGRNGDAMFSGRLAPFDQDDVVLDVLGNRTLAWMHEDSELMKMEREAQQLARKVRQAEGEERARLEKELRTRLESIFDQKLRRQEEEVEHLEEELARVQERLAERRRARQEIIERRQKQLLGDRDVLEW